MHPLICANPPGQTIYFYIVSDFNTKVIGPSTESDSGHTSNSVWLAHIPEAMWIWDLYSDHNPKTLTFKVQFVIPGSPSSGILRIAFDDYLLSVVINGDDTGCKFSQFEYGSEKNCNILPHLIRGVNTAYFTVENTSGPGGLLYLMNISIAI